MDAFYKFSYQYLLKGELKAFSHETKTSELRSGHLCF